MACFGSLPFLLCLLQEFSYDGGIDTAPDIVLHPKTYGNDIWGSTCAQGGMTVVTLTFEPLGSGVSLFFIFIQDFGVIGWG